MQRSIEGVFSAGAMVEGKYRVERMIGRGGMGDVLLARDIALDRPVALKVVRPPEGDDAGFIDQFRQEAATMARIRSEHVADVYAFGEHGGFVFFAMEYVQGEDLERFIERTDRPPCDVVAGIMTQICAGLAAIHRHGVVHRDIKPANVVIGPLYRVSLVDFGVAPIEPTGGLLVGTPDYLAPELLVGGRLTRSQQQATDLYAAALCAFKLLTGRLPFAAADDLFEALSMRLESAPAPPSSFRPDLGDRAGAIDRVMLRALSKDPAGRYPGAEDLGRALCEVLRSPASTEPRVLIVDDNPTIRELYAAVLEAKYSDVAVDCAADGLIALEMARARQPAVILLDLNMPRLDGRGLCLALRSVDQLRDVPVVVISGEEAVDDAEAMEAIGAREALRKPLSGRQLAEVVERHVPQLTAS